METWVKALMATMRYSFKLTLAMLAMMAIVACTPTPDMGRLSDESVKEMLWLYQIMLPAELEAAVSGTIAPGGSGQYGDYLREHARTANYASLYLAMQCHNGVEASVSGFRKFIEPLLWMLAQDRGDYVDHDFETMTVAKDTIEQIVSRAQARKQLGLSPMMAPCERPYIAPQSAAEAELAAGLIRAFIMPAGRRRLGGAVFRSFGYQSNIERTSTAAIGQWFSKSDAQEIGFLEWYWPKACHAWGLTC